MIASDVLLIIIGVVVGSAVAATVREALGNTVWWRTTHEGSVVPLALRSAAPEGSCFPAPALLVAPAPVAEPSWPPLNHGHGPTEEERLRALEPCDSSCQNGEDCDGTQRMRRLAQREMAKPLTDEQRRLIVEPIALATLALKK